MVSSIAADVTTNSTDHHQHSLRLWISRKGCPGWVGLYGLAKYKGYISEMICAMTQPLCKTGTKQVESGGRKFKVINFRIQPSFDRRQNIHEDNTQGINFHLQGCKRHA